MRFCCNNCHVSQQIGVFRAQMAAAAAAANASPSHLTQLSVYFFSLKAQSCCSNDCAAAPDDQLQPHDMLNDVGRHFPHLLEASRCSFAGQTVVFLSGLAVIPSQPNGVDKQEGAGWQMHCVMTGMTDSTVAELCHLNYTAGGSVKDVDRPQRGWHMSVRGDFSHNQGSCWQHQKLTAIAYSFCPSCLVKIENCFSSFGRGTLWRY